MTSLEVSMDASTLALAAVEIISRLKDEMTKAHDRIVLLEQEVVEKDRCIEQLTDSLMLRVIESRRQKGASG
jgi:hypothetical protein